MANQNSSILRMFGGVAGAMDQADSNTLSTLADGRRAFMPSRKYMNQMMQQTQSMNNFVQEQPVSFSPAPIQAYVQQKKDDNMDISKYIGKEKKSQIVSPPNSQVEVLKTVLKPVNDQLEKICILLGLIYQKLDNSEGQEESYTVPISNADINLPEEEEGSLEEQTARLESQLNALPKAPSSEELDQTTTDDIDL